MKKPRQLSKSTVLPKRNEVSAKPKFLTVNDALDLELAASIEWNGLEWLLKDVAWKESGDCWLLLDCQGYEYWVNSTECKLIRNGLPRLLPSYPPKPPADIKPMNTRTASPTADIKPMPSVTHSVRLNTRTASPTVDMAPTDTTPTVDKLLTASPTVDKLLTDINDKFHWHLLTDPNQLEGRLEEWMDVEVIGVDTETTGLDPHTASIRLLQISAPGLPVLVIDFFSNTNWPGLRELLQSDRIIKVAHNWKFDWKFLTRAGYQPKHRLFDTFIAEELVMAGRLCKSNLKAIAQKYLKLDLSKDERLTDWSQPELSSEQLQYAALDAAILLPLREKLNKELEKLGLTKVAQIEFDAVSAVAEIELTGMRLDVDKWSKLFSEIQLQREEVAEKIHQQLQHQNNQLSLFDEVNQVNLDSPKDLLKALNSVGIQVNSTANKVLAPLVDKYPLLGLILEYRKHSKALSSFGNPLPKLINPQTNRIHPTYWQMGTDSGRFSCSEPNMQQIPRGKDFRECFVPEAGHKFVIADYSQIELRIGAEISGDAKMIAAYSANSDLHRLTASLVLDKPESEITKAERQLGKPTNFGLLYGQSASGYKAYAEATYGVKISDEEAEQFRRRHFENYSGLKSWHQQIYREIDQIKTDKKVASTRTLTGRRRLFTDPNKVYLNPLANTPVQGTGADILKLALGRLQEALEGTGAKIVGAIHDEIILEVPEATAPSAAQILVETMEAAGNEILKKVPVIAEVGIGDSWADKA